MVSCMDAMSPCIFNMCEVSMCIATVLFPGATSGVLLKKKSVSQGSFLRGKSVRGKLQNTVKSHGDS